MNTFDLRIEFLDDTEKIATAIAADLVAFETKFDMSVAGLTSDSRITYIFFIAYCVMKRTGHTKESFEKWTESVAMVSEAEAKK